MELGTLSDGITARPAGAEFVAVDNGNVGIGIAVPTAKLEIASGINGVSGLKFSNMNNNSPATNNASALGVGDG